MPENLSEYERGSVLAALRVAIDAVHSARCEMRDVEALDSTFDIVEQADALLTDERNRLIKKFMGS